MMKNNYDLETLVAEAISNKPDVNICYRDLVFLKKEKDQWVVEYETYFNPHANPKFLFDKKCFSNAVEAAAFFIEVIVRRSDN